MGRFISLDPWFGDIADPQSLNKYAYVRNNPLKFVDNTGEMFENPLDKLKRAIVNKVKQTAVNAVKKTASAAAKVVVNTAQKKVQQVVDTAAEAAPEAAEVAPYTGDVNDVHVVVTGKSLFTGEKVSTTERVLTVAAAVVPGVSAGQVKKIIKEGPVVGQKVWRIFGGKSGAMGQSWTPVDPQKLNNPRNDLGLPDANTGEFTIQGTLRNTDNIKAQPATALDGNQGGATEYIIPSPQEQVKIEKIDKNNP